jgi:hypothetical protein
MGVNVNLMGDSIVEAFISVAESMIYAKNQAGEYLMFDGNGAYISAPTEVLYLSRKALVDSIALI